MRTVTEIVCLLARAFLARGHAGQECSSHNLQAHLTIVTHLCNCSPEVFCFQILFYR